MDDSCFVRSRRNVVRFKATGNIDDANKKLVGQMIAKGALVIRETCALNTAGERCLNGSVSLVITLEDYHPSREILIERLIAYADAKGLIMHLPSSDNPGPAYSMLDCLVESDA